MSSNSNKMALHPGDLCKHRPDILGPLRDINLQQFLHSEGEALFLRHGSPIIKSVKVGKRLEVCLMLYELFCASMQQPDMWIDSNRHLAVQLHDEPHDSVRGGVLRSEIQLERAQR